MRTEISLKGQSNEWIRFTFYYYRFFFTLAFFLQRKDKFVVKEFLERQTQKRNGTMIEGGLLYYPRLILQHEQTKITVSFIPGGGTRFRRPDLTYAQFHLSRRSENFFRIIRKSNSIQFLIDEVLGVQGIPIGNHRFDNLFIVKSNNEDFIYNVLTHEIQENLMIYSDQNIDIKFRDALFVLAIPGIVRTEELYDKIITTTILFYNRLKGISDKKSMVHDQFRLSQKRN